ncbi:MAG: NAD-dependent DNA ligase LigA, partial [Clostridia bacterium]|nr:NAD-dependent DNA ligase LigA [Clostridia bacterium]
GGEPLSAFSKYTHKHRLYSLDKAQSIPELKEWLEKAEKSVGKVDYSIEYKFDGLTINLSYNKGKFVRATTRGNGEVGEDVSEQVLTIKTFPLTIDYQGELEVVGEGIMLLSDLEKYNKTAQVPLKNARNAVAGAIRNLDPKETAKRSVKIVFYSINYIEDEDLIKSQKDVIDFLNKNKFKTSPYFALLSDVEEIATRVEEIGQKRNELDFLIDGVVIKMNDYKAREIMGYTEKFPKWAVAYKFEAEETTTTLKDVIWQVGRSGKLTPLAHLEPVDLCGVTVSKATLNNYGDILRKNVKIGDRVFIRRSNDVIPEILGTAQTFDNSIMVKKPCICPSCNGNLTEIGAHLFCLNENCKDQTVQRITHFATKQGMNIDGFSEMTAEKLYDTLNLRNPSEIYTLTKDQLLTVEGFKDKKVDNLLKSVENSKNAPFDKFIYALGISNVGAKTAKDLAKNYVNLEELKNANVERLIEIEDVGEIVAESIVEFFANPKKQEEVNALLKYVKIEYPKKDNKVGVFTGEKVVLTGTLANFTRSKAGEIIESLGGEILSGISKKTTLVLVGEDAGSKLKKAQALNIKIIDEQQFIKMIGGN